MTNEEILKDERDYALKLVTESKGEYRYLPERLQADREITMAALDQDSSLHILDHMPDSLRSDMGLARHAAEQMEKVQTRDFVYQMIQSHFSQDICEKLEGKILDASRPVSHILSEELEPLKLPERVRTNVFPLPTVKLHKPEQTRDPEQSL